MRSLFDAGMLNDDKKHVLGFHLFLFVLRNFSIMPRKEKQKMKIGRNFLSIISYIEINVDCYFHFVQLFSLGC